MNSKITHFFEDSKNCFICDEEIINPVIVKKKSRTFVLCENKGCKTELIEFLKNN